MNKEYELLKFLQKELMAKNALTFEHKCSLITKIEEALESPTLYFEDSFEDIEFIHIEGKAKKGFIADLDQSLKDKFKIEYTHVYDYEDSIRAKRKTRLTTLKKTGVSY